MKHVLIASKIGELKLSVVSFNRAASLVPKICPAVRAEVPHSRTAT